jgi:mannose-6-phosphate isomerase-like protein (cupin superfamily)
MAVINLAQKFARLHEYWTPQLYAEIGNVYIKLVKVKGAYVWHKHDNEDKLYMVMKGQLRLKFRESRDIVIDAGECYLVPRRTEHQPVAEEETNLILVEPMSASLKEGDANAIKQIFIAEVDYLS